MFPDHLAAFFGGVGGRRDHTQKYSPIVNTEPHAIIVIFACRYFLKHYDTNVNAKKVRVSKMTQWVKHLLHKYDRSLIPET